ESLLSPVGPFCLFCPETVITNRILQSSPLHCDNRHASSFRSACDYMQLDERGIFAMTKPLVVSIPHSLGRDEAMRRLKTGLSRAASSVPVLSVDEERWEDN